ncbi:unnamed protein product [Spirodela intermedia]|uniref:Uncharacterized protein n=2 Tax=Spirodela intermedia TaxID=51605 RepID=A0A7I8IXH7_SPIIN|nr:unnamed protein product [Spirodela intermedia]CAA6662557.1 unnamed protein product [Spirodela intermedia]CAA7398960.1 unnamed protein product [Spirodela intermedia]
MAHDCSGQSQSDGIGLDGASVGAAMSVQPAASRGETCSYCGGSGSDVYVNSNVQGVTNSVLVGCTVVVKDAGARCRFLRRGGGGGALCTRRPRHRRAARHLWRPYLPAALLLMWALVGFLCWKLPSSEPRENRLNPLPCRNL